MVQSAPIAPKCCEPKARARPRSSQTFPTLAAGGKSVRRQQLFRTSLVPNPMTLQSMTGFSRSDGALGPCAWYWEARSVNNRGLDVRIRLASGYDALEAKVREEIASRFTRGSVSVGLNVQRAGAQSEVRLNEAALAQVTAAAERVRELTGAAPARIDGLLSIRGVLETVDVIETETETAARHAEMLASLRTTLDGLGLARAAEGQRLHQVVAAQVDEIARLTALVDASPARTVDAIRTRIGALVGKLVETGQGLDPARLHQEAVMIATRADVEEELKRLKAHVEAARDLLAKPQAAGRKLDFLAQEFNREANTLTSKASDNEIAAHGLALKVVIDQMREQVQNIE